MGTHFFLVNQCHFEPHFMGYMKHITNISSGGGMSFLLILAPLRCYEVAFQIAAIMSAVTDLTASWIFFLEVVYVIDSSLVDPVFDIAPEEKVQRCEIWRPGGPSSRTSTSNPGITKSGVKISSDVPGPVWRGSVLLEHQVWDVSNCSDDVRLQHVQVIGPNQNRVWGFSVPHILQLCLFTQCPQRVTKDRMSISLFV